MRIWVEIAIGIERVIKFQSGVALNLNFAIELGIELGMHFEIENAIAIVIEFEMKVELEIGTDIGFEIELETMGTTPVAYVTGMRTYRTQKQNRMWPHVVTTNFDDAFPSAAESPLAYRLQQVAASMSQAPGA